MTVIPLPVMSKARTNKVSIGWDLDRSVCKTKVMGHTLLSGHDTI